MALTKGDGGRVSQAGIHKHLPVGFTEAVFGELFPRPLCELFQPSDAPGFVGHCLVNNMSRTCQGVALTLITCPPLLSNPPHQTGTLSAPKWVN